MWPYLRGDLTAFTVVMGGGLCRKWTLGEGLLYNPLTLLCYKVHQFTIILWSQLKPDATRENFKRDITRTALHSESLQDETARP